MKKIYEFAEAMATLEQAETFGIPYKVIKTSEPIFSEVTERVQLVPVWLFKFLEGDVPQSSTSPVVEIISGSDEDDAE